MSSTATTEWGDLIDVANRIDAIERRTPPSEAFIPTRYPYTYAYDYMRSHAEEFGLPHNLSRADCAGVVQGQRKEAVVRLLADAYLREHHITAPDSGS